MTTLFSIELIAALREVLGPVDGETPLVSRTAGRDALLRLFTLLGFQRGAEIGVWTGKFSKRICQRVPGVQLLCVDPWTAYDAYHERKNDRSRLETAFVEAQARLQPYACTILRMTSLEAAARVPDRSLDFVYIDGNHARAHVRADLEAWTPKIRDGGILAGHDFRTTPEKPFIEVEPVVRAFTAERGIAPWFVLAAERTPSFFWVVS